jgi:heme/copper-type cytochrome/quinol oxidase subunit 3
LSASIHRVHYSTLLGSRIYPHHQRPDGLLAMLLTIQYILYNILLFVVFIHTLYTCNALQSAQHNPQLDVTHNLLTPEVTHSIHLALSTLTLILSNNNLKPIISHQHQHITIVIVFNPLITSVMFRTPRGYSALVLFALLYR